MNFFCRARCVDLLLFRSIGLKRFKFAFAPSYVLNRGNERTSFSRRKKRNGKKEKKRKRSPNTPRRYYYRIVFRDTSIFLSFFPKGSLIIDCVVNDKASTFYDLFDSANLWTIRIAKRRLKRTLASLSLDYYYYYYRCCCCYYYYYYYYYCRLYCVAASRKLSL